MPDDQLPRPTISGDLGSFLLTLVAVFAGVLAALLAHDFIKR